MLRVFKFFRNRARLRNCQALIVGLGNPGRQYAGTRHNVGFSVVDILAQSMEYPCRMHTCRSDVVVGKLFENRIVVLAKPRTYVNRSGEAFAGLIGCTSLEKSSVLVVVDDFNLPLGKVRFRNGGSDGGHNGLKSLIGAAGEDFPRLRVGTGPLPRGVPVIDFVLGSFSEKEMPVITDVMLRCVSAVQCFMLNGIERAMSEYNR